MKREFATFQKWKTRQTKGRENKATPNMRNQGIKILKSGP